MLANILERYCVTKERIHKMEMLREKVKYGVVIGIIFLLGLMWAVWWPVRQVLSIEVEYAGALPGVWTQIFYRETGEEFTEKNSIGGDVPEGYVRYELGRKYSQIESVRIDPSNSEEVFSIKSVRYYINDVKVISYSYDEIANHFEIHNASYVLDDTNETLNIVPINNDVNMIATAEHIGEMIDGMADELENKDIAVRVARVFLFAIIGLVIVLREEKLFAFLDDIFSEKNSCFNVATIIMMFVSMITVGIIAFSSELGVHPDEWDVVACLKYGMTHWFPPDIRDADVSSTFSGYGYTKLENGTWYFLLFGKIAWLAQCLFGVIKWFRVPNVLLFLIMGYLYCKNISKKNWLILTSGICVQVWYIFSYTTADAWDFFLSFLILLQLTQEDSLLNRAITLPVNCKNVLRCLIMGVLFGMLFLGKQVYWAVLLLAFIALLFKLLETNKEQKKVLVFNYCIIIGFFCLTVLSRYGFDLYHYGVNGAQIKEEMEIIYADYDKNPTTPLEERCTTYHMYENGSKLYELFEEKPDWFKDTYKSFCGLVNDEETSEVYFAIVGALYLFMYFCLAHFNMSTKKEIKCKVEFVLLSAIMIINLVASILNSYLVDCQTQGRYLLPIVIVAGYMGYRTPKAFEKKYFKLAALLVNVLSVWYFATRALEIVV